MEQFVKQCQVCQQAKHLNTHTPGLLQPLPIPQGVWQDISLDFVEGLPKYEGFEVILVVVDRFTKYAHFFALKHPYSALTVARVLYDGVVKLHGLPQTMVSDRDKVFTSNVWTEMFKLVGVKLLFSTAYHPQMDGQTERVNRAWRCICAVQWVTIPNNGRSYWLRRSIGTTLTFILHWDVLRSRLCTDMTPPWEYLLQFHKTLTQQFQSLWRIAKDSSHC